MKKIKYCLPFLFLFLFTSCNSTSSIDFDKINFYYGIGLNEYDYLLDGSEDSYAHENVNITHQICHFYGYYTKDPYEFIYVAEFKEKSDAKTDLGYDTREYIGNELFIYNTSIGLPKTFTDKGSYSLLESYELNILNNNDLSKINLLYKAYYGEIEDPKGEE